MGFIVELNLLPLTLFSFQLPDLGWWTGPSTSSWLAQHLTKTSVIHVKMRVIHSHMSISALVIDHRYSPFECDHRPLKMIRSVISVLSVRAKWAGVVRRNVNKTVPNHFIFTLKTFATFTPRAALHRTVMWPPNAVDNCMRTMMRTMMRI